MNTRVSLCARSGTSKGFTLVEILIAVAIVGLLIALAVPNIFRARSEAHLDFIKNNLRRIDDAKEQYALEQGLATTTTVSISELEPYIRFNRIVPVVGESYDATEIGNFAFADLNGEDLNGVTGRIIYTGEAY